MKICVCGGGSLAHAVAGVLGANSDVRVNVLSRQADRWANVMRVEYLDDYLLYGGIHHVSDDPQDVIAGCDMIIICVPHIARAELLLKIKPFIKAGAWVGSFPGFAGFAWQARYILAHDVNLFGLQRVPYVRGEKEYGISIKIKGIRARNFVASIPSARVNIIADILRQLMNLYVIPVPNYLNICFSRSNSVCHPARIYSLLKDWDGKSPISKKKIKFYGDWDDDASKVFLQLDHEIKAAISKIPLDIDSAESVLAYYEVASAKDLTIKMQKVRAMNENYIPLIKVKGGYIPDIHSYYFSEDLSYGLIVLKSILSLAGTTSPVVDEIIAWSQKLLNTNFVVDGELKGKDISSVAIPANYGLRSLDELVRFCNS